MLVRPFDALAESIAYQQLSGKAAATIWGRVRALIRQAQMARSESRCSRRRTNSCARAAFRGNKTIAIKDLAAKTIDGIVPPGPKLAKMSDEEIIERLTAVRGIGRWTVEMLLLFELGRPDVWPVTDFGVQKGYAKTFGKRKLPTPKQLQTHR